MMGDCGCSLDVERCSEHQTDVVLVLSAADYRRVEYALRRAAAHAVAFADNTPYPDDPRWTPWTRFGKPVAERCTNARKIIQRGQVPRP
jgi:hypothetical protein